MKNLIAFVSLLFLYSIPSTACTVCFGGANAELARGFQWGIIVLGALPYLMLVFFVGYIVFQTRKNNRRKDVVEG